MRASGQFSGINRFFNSGNAMQVNFLVKQDRTLLANQSGVAFAIATLQAIGLAALLGLALPATAQEQPQAQTQQPAPAAKVVDIPPPSIETAVTPYEEIRINGKSIPLTLKTLAELQRLQQEKALAEKIQEAVSTKAPVVSSSNKAVVAKVVTEENEEEGVEAKAAAKEAAPKKKPKPVNQLIAVWGPAGDMTAEVIDSASKVVQLKRGQTWAGFEVLEVTVSGLRLRGQSAVGGYDRFVSIGQKVL